MFCVFDVNQKHEEKYYRTSSDLMDKKSFFIHKIWRSPVIFFFVLLVFRHKEREAQSFYSGFFICPPPHTCGTRHKGLRKQAKANRLLPRQVSTLVTFFKFPKSSPRFRCLMSPALCNPVSHLGLLWHLWVTHPLHPCTRVNTCVNVAPK